MTLDDLVAKANRVPTAKDFAGDACPRGLGAQHLKRLKHFCAKEAAEAAFQRLAPKLEAQGSQFQDVLSTLTRSVRVLQRDLVSLDGSMRPPMVRSASGVRHFTASGTRTWCGWLWQGVAQPAALSECALSNDVMVCVRCAKYRSVVEVGAVPVPVGADDEF